MEVSSYGNFYDIEQKNKMSPENPGRIWTVGIDNQLNVLATTLFSPLVYCRPGEYSSMKSLHLITLSELKCLYVKFT
jgi:hypothetical protein